MGWVRVHTTRGNDLSGMLTLAQRGQIERDVAPSVVLSIHANANSAPATRGLMAFFWPGSFVGLEMAASIQRSAPTSLRRTDTPYAATREQWPRVRNVLSAYKAPSVLVEVGFLTNEDDAEALRRPAVRRELLVARGINVIEQPAQGRTS